MEKKSIEDGVFLGHRDIDILVGFGMLDGRVSCNRRVVVYFTKVFTEEPHVL